MHVRNRYQRNLPFATPGAKASTVLFLQRLYMSRIGEVESLLQQESLEQMANPLVLPGCGIAGAHPVVR